jgi:hypothetical protein
MHEHFAKWGTEATASLNQLENENNQSYYFKGYPDKLQQII